MLKMSEFTPHFSALFQKIIAQVFPEDLVSVVTGDHNVAQQFSALPFDHLLFTGATSIGRQVMRSASEHLTPVTLELGGKSPSVIMAKDAPLAESVRRIVFGKAINSGQTCVAPAMFLCRKIYYSNLLIVISKPFVNFIPNYPTILIALKSLINAKHNA